MPKTSTKTFMKASTKASTNAAAICVAASRESIVRFQQIPNVGPAIEKDFRLLKIAHPHHLASHDPFELYDRLNAVTGVRQDPCVLDTFIAAVRYMRGAPATPWWKYTAERKRALA
jgi:hypothetical protein